MKVYIDGLPMLTRNPGGVGYYCYNLINKLRQNDSKNEYIVLYNKSKIESAFTVPGPFVQIKYPYRNLRKIFGVNTILSPRIERFVGDFDIYHGTDYTLLPTKRAKKIVTIHDLAIKYYKDEPLKEKFRLQYYNEWIPYFAKKSDRIITASNSTKSDIVNILGIDPEKIDVIPLAADAVYRPIGLSDPEMKSIKDKYSLPDKFLLYVGALKKSKNIPMIIKAFSQILSQIGNEHKLVLIGQKGDDFQTIADTITQCKIENNVLYIGYVDYHDLPYIYNLAKAFVHISLLEGFGLPVLEAMQCGIPVLVASNCSLPEIVQDSGLIADPLDLNDVSQKMGEIMSNDLLRESLSQKAIQRASQFSWDNTAALTIQSYIKALEN